MNRKHSPGPWRFSTTPQPNGCPIVGASNSVMVCMIAHSVKEPNQKDEALSNARIVTASLELLALADRLAAWDKKWPKYHDRSGESEREMDDICAEAHRIIKQIDS